MTIAPFPHQSSESEYYTIEELAQLLGKHRGTLARYRVDGGGPAYIKVGRTVLYERSSVKEWLKSHSFTCTAQYTSR